MKVSTGQNYRKRISRVIEYIYQHLDSDLDVNTLADVALMSPYHFHRIYRQIAQETVNMTVRRLNITIGDRPRFICNYVSLRDNLFAHNTHAHVWRQTTIFFLNVYLVH